MEKTFILSILLVTLCLVTREVSCMGETALGTCSRTDREALTDFKNGLKDPSNRLSSWKGGNCCQWEGIACENATGAVTSIHLRNPHFHGDEYDDQNWGSMSLSGEIRPSLTQIKSLRHLDLSGNSFERTPMPKFIGSLQNLQYLNLSSCGFSGAIPPNLGNLSNLQFLDLSSISSDLFADDLQWVTSLVSLKHLEMNHVDLSRVQLRLEEVLKKLPLVMELHLDSCLLVDPVPSSTSINSTSLSVIRISHNFYTKFPAWLVNVSSLVSIDASFNQLAGQIPAGLGELPNLQYLDLSGNKKLNQSFSQLLRGSWKEIEVLNLALSKFFGTIPSSILNLCNLKYLDVGYNSLTGSLPEHDLRGKNNCSISDGRPLPKLRYVDMSNNRLAGGLPEWLSQLEALTHLNLFNNTYQGLIPSSLGSSRNLQYLSLGWNELNGSVPVSFGRLSELVGLDISVNRLTGILSEQHFFSLTKLKNLAVHENPGLVLNVSSAWVPPFQISELSMDSCKLGPSFPAWLQSQAGVLTLDISNGSISGPVPSWFWNITSTMRVVYLYLNNLEGHLPKQLNVAPRALIDFSFNRFEGPIPLPTNRESFLLDLSNNEFSGSIPAGIGESMPELWSLSLSGNRLTGVIPISIGYMASLKIVDLSGNGLTGSIPSSIGNCSSLTFISLEGNNLSGAIPDAFGQLQWLQSLHLSKNSLSGQLPSSFENLSNLEILDLSHNKLSGSIPAWVGAAFENLQILNMRSNAFSGELPGELSNMSSLHILDLAGNNLSGSIPTGLGGLKAMTQRQNVSRYLHRLIVMMRPHEDSMVVNSKGQSLEYVKALSLVISLDLSNNNFTGEFPGELTELSGLMTLNLSGNHLEGRIPENISRLHELLSLDLSSNNLYGEIPSSMSTLTFLSYLNLSHNNFSGKIPFTGQMTTFTDPAFAGNPRLCGPPLFIKCQDDEEEEGRTIVGDERSADDGFFDQWFCLSVGVGFAAGILVPFVIVMLKKSWCEAYFSFADKVIDRTCTSVQRRRALRRRKNGRRR